MKCLVDDFCCVSRDKRCFFFVRVVRFCDPLVMECTCEAWLLDWQLVEWNQTQAITLKSWICDFQVTLWWFKIAMESYGKGSIYGRIACEMVMFHSHVRWPDVCDMWVMCISFHSVWIKHRAHQKNNKVGMFSSNLAVQNKPMWNEMDQIADLDCLY